MPRTHKGLVFPGGAARSFAAVMAISLSTGLAFAEPSPEEKALATQLFREGRELMSDGKIPQACLKLAESHRLDPSGGTVLNLAVCREKEGKLASAWLLFSEGLSLARAAGRKDRAEVASKALDRLEKLVPRVTLKLPDDRPEGFKLSFDGLELSSAAWDSQIPLDPGEHTFSAVATSSETWTTSVILASGDRKSVVIPTLKKKEIPPPVAPSASSAPEPTPSAMSSSITPPSAPPAAESTRKSTTPLRNGAMIASGVMGVIGVGLATAFTVDALGKKNESNKECAGGCTAQGVTHNNSALASADRATGFAIAGGVGLGVAALLYFTRPTTRISSQPNTGWVLLPESTGSFHRLTVEHAW